MQLRTVSAVDIAINRARILIRAFGANLVNVPIGSIDLNGLSMLHTIREHLSAIKEDSQSENSI